MTDLNTLASSALVAIYNELVPVLTTADSPLSTIKKFADKATAVKRVTRMLDDANKALASGGKPELTVTTEGTLVSPLDAKAPSNLEEFVRQGSAATGGEQVVLVSEKPDGTTEAITDQVPVEGAADTSEKAPVTPVETPKAAPKAAAAAKSSRTAAPPKNNGGRPPSVADEDIITLVHVGDNPKRAEAARRFAKYKTGMTVLQYIEAIGDRRQALRDVAWDMKQGWISISGKPKAKAAPAETAKAEEPQAEPETSEAPAPEAAQVEQAA